MNKNYTLNNGLEIPVVGFGTWQTPDGEVAELSVLTALKAGYTHIDTAAAYKNEESVGRAIKKSGLNREDLYITTKLANPSHTHEDAQQSIKDSLEKLDLDYIDLYLIHWPNPVTSRHEWKKRNADSWRAMEEAVDAGLIKSIGVSNFHPHHIDALLETARIKPAVNQILLNPSDMQEELVRYNKKHDILSEAYSPLGTGKIFEVESLKDLASKYNKTVAQVVIRWSLHHGFLPLPKSITHERIVSNFDVYDFELSPEDIALIDGLKGTAGSAIDPDTTNF